MSSTEHIALLRQQQFAGVLRRLLEQHRRSLAEQTVANLVLTGRILGHSLPVSGSNPVPSSCVACLGVVKHGLHDEVCQPTRAHTTSLFANRAPYLSLQATSLNT